MIGFMAELFQSKKAPCCFGVSSIYVETKLVGNRDSIIEVTRRHCPFVQVTVLTPFRPPGPCMLCTMPST